MDHPIQGCDYVNASWVRGINESCKFIAAQGPLNHTLQHFLQMILENDVQMVVMLTNLQETSAEGKICIRQIKGPCNNVQTL